jgi:hypothetical protein
MQVTTFEQLTPHREAIIRQWSAPDRAASLSLRALAALYGKSPATIRRFLQSVLTTAYAGRAQEKIREGGRRSRERTRRRDLSAVAPPKISTTGPARQRRSALEMSVRVQVLERYPVKSWQEFSESERAVVYARLITRLERTKELS